MDKFLKKQEYEMHQLKENRDEIQHMKSDQIGDFDDMGYDQVQREIKKIVGSQPRIVDKQLHLKLQSQLMRELDIEPILSEFACSICKDTPNDPMVIKHCFHFFCKDCIDTNILRL